MRKVLLTTTALVALGGISAASALDISGFQRMEYQGWDDTGTTEGDGNNDTQIADYNRVQFNHSITGDNGLTASGYYRINNWAEAYHDISVSGDFGTVSLGNYTTAGGFMYNSQYYNGTFRAATGQTFTGVNTSASAAIADGGDNSINWTAPSMNGFSLMVTQTDAGTAAADDATEVGIAYSTDMNGMGLRIHGISAQADDSTGIANDKQENMEFGVNLTTGPFAFRFTNESAETIGSDSELDNDVDTNEMSMTYAASDDLTVGIVNLSSKDKVGNNNAELSMTTFGANYFIMPGLRVQAAYNDFDYETTAGNADNAGSSTVLSLRIDF